jgi:hypothetical protein
MPDGPDRQGKAAATGLFFQRMRCENSVNTLEKAKPAQISDCFSQEAITIFASHYLLLLVGPIVAGLLAYGVSSFFPAKYVSVAYLRMVPSTAPMFVGMVTSPTIVNKVLSKYPNLPEAVERRVRFVSQRIGLTDTEPSGDRQSMHLFLFDFTHDDPHMAQEINAALIDAWIETTPPGPVERANLERELDRLKITAAANSALIERLLKETTTLVAPNSMSGEIATLISSLITKRDQSLEAISKIEDRLAGVPRDIIVAPPNLPSESVRSRKGFAFLAAALALPVILAILLFVRRLKGRQV